MSDIFDIEKCQKKSMEIKDKLTVTRWVGGGE